MLSPFGQQLRLWRRRFGYSQLELATRAGTTPRHLSFIETGRSRPGRELVLRIAASMDLRIRERNALLVSAGLPPEFAERSLDDEDMAPYRMAIEAILKRHEPYPASAMDPLGCVVLANQSAKLLFPGAEQLSPEQMLDSFLAPGPGRESLANWAEVAWSYADRLQQTAAGASDPRLAELAERALTHLAGVDRPEATQRDSPVMTVNLRVGDQVIRTFATVMVFEAPHEVTISELRVELMFPVDEVGDAFFRSLGSSSSSSSQDG